MPHGIDTIPMLRSRSAAVCGMLVKHTFSTLLLLTKLSFAISKFCVNSPRIPFMIVMACSFLNPELSRCFARPYVSKWWTHSPARPSTAVCGEGETEGRGGDGDRDGDGDGDGDGGFGCIDVCDDGGLSSTPSSALITVSTLRSGDAVSGALGSTAVPCRCRRAAATGYSSRFEKRSDGYRNESRGSDIVCGEDRVCG